QHNSVKDAVANSAAGNPSQFKVPGDVDSDGEVEDYSLLLGGNFANNKGNATLFLGYHKQQPVRQDQRDFGACSLAATGEGFVSVNTLAFDNPLLSDGFKSTFGITPTNPVDFIVQRRNVEGGPRIFDYRTTSYRGVGGVKGEVWGGWNYDLYYELGRV